MKTVILFQYKPNYLISVNGFIVIGKQRKRPLQDIRLRDSALGPAKDAGPDAALAFSSAQGGNSGQLFTGLEEVFRIKLE